MRENKVAEAYESSWVDVESMLGIEVSPGDNDRDVIEPWAEAVDGSILDVGSGTGRWSGHLAKLGHEVEGLEPADRLINLARAQYPDVVFHHCSIEDLHSSESRWDGILAWYSLIHMGPQELPHALTALHSVLDDGGALLMSFFAGPRLEAFYHPITTAYRWPMADMVKALQHVGFDVTEQHSNPHSPHAYINAFANKS